MDHNHIIHTQAITIQDGPTYSSLLDNNDVDGSSSGGDSDAIDVNGVNLPERGSKLVLLGHSNSER